MAKRKEPKGTTIIEFNHSGIPDVHVIHSPSRVFENEVGVMTMRGLGKDVLKESKEQAKIIRTAARYLTGEAREGNIVTTSNDNRRSYNNSDLHHSDAADGRAG